MRCPPPAVHIPPQTHSCSPTHHPRAALTVFVSVPAPRSIPFLSPNLFSTLGCPVVESSSIDPSVFRPLSSPLEISCPARVFPDLAPSAAMLVFPGETAGLPVTLGRPSPLFSAELVVRVFRTRYVTKSLPWVFFMGLKPPPISFPLAA